MFRVIPATRDCFVFSQDIRKLRTPAVVAHAAGGHAEIAAVNSGRSSSGAYAANNLAVRTSASSALADASTNSTLGRISAPVGE